MKNLIKILILLIVFNSYSQKAKYILFDKTKDSIVIFGKIKYYKIDRNLFLVEGDNNFRIKQIEIDTILFRRNTEN